MKSLLADKIQKMILDSGRGGGYVLVEEENIIHAFFRPYNSTESISMLSAILHQARETAFYNKDEKTAEIAQALINQLGVYMESSLEGAKQ